MRCSARYYSAAIPLLAALILVAPFSAHPAFSVPEFPALSGRVVDNADLLDGSQEREITRQLEKHESETSNQVVVVTLSRLQGMTIEEYSNRLGRHWGIGQAGRNNGILLVVAPKLRKVRIEVGYGLESDLPDATSRQIIHQEILPAFRNNNYPHGIMAGVDAILAAIAGSYEPQPTPKPLVNRVLPFIGPLFLLFFVLMGYIHVRYGASHNSHRTARARRSGGQSSGGGFRGGGGSFGGGGSSGGW